MINWYTNFCNGVIIDVNGVANYFVQTGVRQEDGHTAYDLLDDGDSIVSIDDVEHENSIRKLHESLKLDEARQQNFMSVHEAEAWMCDMNHWLAGGLSYQQALVEVDRQWANRLNGRPTIGWRSEQFAGCYAHGQF